MQQVESVNLPEKVCTEGDVFSCCGTIDEVTMGISMSTNADDSDCVFSGTNIKVLRFENKKKTMIFHDIQMERLAHDLFGQKC